MSSMYKAPKSGRGLGFTFGGKYCKDVCSTWDRKKPWGQNYTEKFYCRSCDGWFTYDKLNDKNRCSCCNRQVRFIKRGKKVDKLG